MKRIIAALGLAALTGTTMLSAVGPASADPAKAPVAVADAGMPGRGPGPQGGPGPKEGPGARWDRGPMGGPGRRDEMQLRLAEKLAGAETLLGIHSDQLDAWRDYTSALLALFAPPPPPAPDQDAAKAFAREEQLIRRINERAAMASTLEKSIAALKAKLTPDQLDKLGKLELAMRPPMRGPGEHGMHGPGRGGPRFGAFGDRDGGPGFGPGPGMHRFAPGDGPGAPPAPDAAPGAPDDGAQPDSGPAPG